MRLQVRLAEQLAQSGLQVQVLKALLALRSMPAADVGEVCAHACMLTGQCMLLLAAF